MRWNLSHPLLHGLPSKSLENGVQWAVQCLACMAVAWVVAQGVWWLATPGSASLATKAAPTLLEQSQRVQARHFFGAPDRLPPTGAPSESTPAQATQTRWRLIGTYVSSHGHSLAVLVLEDGSDTVVAKVGDQLSTGHEVVEVQADSVVLSKDAQPSQIALRTEAQGPQEPGPAGDRFGMQSPFPVNKDSR